MKKATYVLMLIFYFILFNLCYSKTFQSKNIITQTFVTYEKLSGKKVLAVSNYVKVSVNEIVDFEVENYTPNIDVEILDDISLIYSLQNFSNIKEGYILNIINHDMFSEVNIYEDINKNGILDEDEKLKDGRIEKTGNGLFLCSSLNPKEKINFILRGKLKRTLEIDKKKLYLKIESISQREINKKIENIINIYSKRDVDVRKGIYFDEEEGRYYFTFKFLNESSRVIDELYLEDDINKSFVIGSYKGKWQNFNTQQLEEVTFFDDGIEEKAENIEVSLINNKLKFSLKDVPIQAKNDVGGILYIPFFVDRKVNANEKLTNYGRYNYIIKGVKSLDFDTNDVIFFNKYMPKLELNFVGKKDNNGYIEFVTKIKNNGNGNDIFNIYIENSDFPKGIKFKDPIDANMDKIIDTGNLKPSEEKEIVFLVPTELFEDDRDYSLNLIFRSIKDDKYNKSTTIYKDKKKMEKKELTELLTTIKSDKTRIKRGDILTLTVDISNGSEYDVNNLMTKIKLPRGFSYFQNSFKVNNNIIKSVEKKGDSLKILFQEPFKAKESISFSFIARCTNIAEKESYITTFSRGDVDAFTKMNSNSNSCKITVDEEKIFETGTIFGKIYVDENKNNLYDEGEMTVPNAKVFLENGHFAITDINGNYSIFGEKGETHIVCLDKTTIPKGAILKGLDSRYNEEGNKVVITLRKNELHKVNFAFSEADDSFIEKIKERKVINKEMTTEIEEVIENEELTFGSNGIGGNIENQGYFDNRMSALVSSNDNFYKKKEKELLTRLEKKQKIFDELENEKLKKDDISIEERIKNMDNSFDIINLSDLQVVDSVISVEIKNSSENESYLYLNGELLNEDLIGISGYFADKKLSYYKYEGIKLDREINKLTLVSKLTDGEIEKKEITLIYPSIISKVSLVYDESKIDNYSGEPLDLAIILENKDGYKIKKPYFISIENSSGLWITPEDISKDKGLQFIIENGEKKLKLIPSSLREIDFKIKVGDKTEETTLDIKTNKSPILTLGIIEGRLSFNKKNIEIFESGERFNYRTAVFSKGSLNEDYSFVFQYDNKKDDEDVFFQNNKRDNYYLVFGDDSIKGYEAQSKSKLYLLLEGKNTKYLYGDYTISWSEENDIGSYSRTLTGYNFNYKSDKLKGEFFISDSKNIRREEEIEGKNISGPYYLKERTIVEGTEQVEIVVYGENKNFPIEIIEPPPYTLDYHTGILYFDTIIPKKAKDGHKIYIRVKYDVYDGDGDREYLYGGKLSYKINDVLEVGSTYINDENPQSEYENRSANITFDKEKYGKLVLEYGETKKIDSKGDAVLINYTNKIDDKLKSKITYYDSSEGFENSDSLVRNNAEFFLIDNQYIIDQDSEISINGFVYKNKEEDNKTEEVVGYYKKNISETSALSVGSKYSSSPSSEKQNVFRTIGANYRWTPKEINGFLTSLEVEKDIDESNKRVSLASEYQYEDMYRIYGKYDFVNNIDNTNIISRYNDSYGKLIGFEYSDFEKIKPFIELREKSGEEKDEELAFGLKGKYSYNDYLTFSGTFERVQNIDTSKINTTNLIFDSIYKKSNENISVNNLTLSDSDRVISVLLKNSYGFKINNNFTFAAKNRYFIKNINLGVARDRFLLGLAYRDLKDVYSYLVKYEMTYDDELENENYVHTAHLFNVINNYQYDKNNMLNFAVGGKYVVDKSGFINSSYTRAMFDFGFSHYMTTKIMLGINAAFSVDTFYRKYYGLGLEAGYKLNDNVFLSVGYNFYGFKDTDFFENEKYANGMYISFKFVTP